MVYSTLEETHFIEDIGLYFERLGLPRMAGKILGVLLISDPPAQSITEIGEKLNASKSSISTMSRLLLEVSGDWFEGKDGAGFDQQRAAGRLGDIDVEPPAITDAGCACPVVDPCSARQVDAPLQAAEQPVAQHVLCGQVARLGIGRVVQGHGAHHGHTGLVGLPESRVQVG